MNDTSKRIAALIGKHLKQELSNEETQELNKWIEEADDNREIFEQLTNADYLEQTIRIKYKTNPVEATRDKLKELIASGGVPINRNENKVRPFWPRLAVAAAVLVLVAISAVFILRKKQGRIVDVAKTPNVKQDVAPGTVKATLKLADGRTVVLDSATLGQLARQGSASITNTNGQLVYDAGNGGEKSEVLWNTLSTTKGQTYPLILSDHSRVWLNSESSIRFPVAFTGDLREVQIAGEVFFEVAHDERKPFMVKTGDVDVQVLGTTFNVDAYSGLDAIKTTLVEGSVQVKKGVQRKTIRPGQQAQVIAGDIKVTAVDVDKVIAWKQGFFRFKEDKLSEAIKNIARWYDVDVAFEGNAANVDVSGTISRSANLSELIKLLELIDVEARIEGRKLILKAQ